MFFKRAGKTTAAGDTSNLRMIRGTTVPLQSLLYSLMNGTSLKRWLEEHPEVTAEQAVKVLETAEQALNAWRRGEDTIYARGGGS